VFQWSSAGAIAGMTCTQLIETADPHTWNDNYLCSNRDFGLRWSSAGAIAGMLCTQIVEMADPHTWQDNYLCTPPASPLKLFWSAQNPIAGKTCVQIIETADPDTWNDNYLCYELPPEPTPVAVTVPVPKTAIPIVNTIVLSNTTGIPPNTTGNTPATSVLNDQKFMNKKYIAMTPTEQGTAKSLSATYFIKTNP
jgi:hypothetical protein